MSPAWAFGWSIVVGLVIYWVNAYYLPRYMEKKIREAEARDRERLNDR